MLSRRLKCVVWMALACILIGLLGYWYLFGFYGTPDVCGAVLRIPSDSPGSKKLFSDETEIVVDDAEIARELAEFFPGIRTRRWTYLGVFSERELEVEFVFGNGQKVKVYIKEDYSLWGSDVAGGDYRVRGDLRAYLSTLLYRLESRKISEAEEEE